MKIPHDKIATKYCFRAKSKIVHAVTGRIRGEFVAYGKTLSVSHDVFVASRMFTEGEDTLECTEPELTVFSECPVECTLEVVFYDTDDDVT